MSAVQDCTKADLVNSIAYNIPFYAVFVTSMMAFLLLGYLIFKLFCCTTLLHKNILLLIGVTIFCCLLIGVSNVACIVLYFYHIYTAKNACDLPIKTSECNFIRTPFLFGFLLLTISHTSIMAERLYATYRVADYEKKGMKLGISLAAASILLSFFIVYLVVKDQDPDEMITSCLTLSASKSVGNNIYIMLRVQFGLNIPTLLVFVSLYVMNKRAGKNGGLSSKFQKAENREILKYTTNMVVTASIVIGLYIFTVSIVRLFKDDMPPNAYEIIAACLFVIPHIPFIISLVLIISIWCHARSRRNNKNRLMQSQNMSGSLQIKMALQQWDNDYNRYEANLAAMERKRKRGKSKVSISTIVV